MKKFEYLHQKRSDKSLIEELSDLGKEGWEFISEYNKHLLLKREIPEKSEITVKYKDIVIDATIIKDFGSKAVILSQDRVSLAFKRGEQWEAFSPGFDLLNF